MEHKVVKANTDLELLKHINDYEKEYLSYYDPSFQPNVYHDGRFTKPSLYVIYIRWSEYHECDIIISETTDSYLLSLKASVNSINKTIKEVETQIEDNF